MSAAPRGPKHQATAALIAFGALILPLACSRARPAAALAEPPQLASVALLPSSTPAKDVEPPTSPSVPIYVQVKGLLRLSPGEVCNRIETRSGLEVQPSTLQADVTRLRLTELFDDVRVETELSSAGLIVTFLLQERALLVDFRVGGMQHPALAGYLEAFPKPGFPFVGRQLDRVINAVKEHYVAVGHRRASVGYSVRNLPDNRVEVEVRVEEGPQTIVRELSLSGLVFVKKSDALAALDTTLGRSNVVGRVFEQDEFENGLRKLEWLYHDRGMLRFKMRPPDIAFSADQDSVSLRLKVEREGPVFRVGTITFTGYQVSNSSPLQDQTGLKRGAVFRRKDWVAGRERVRSLLGGGDIVLSESMTLDDSASRVDIAVRVFQGPK